MRSTLLRRILLFVFALVASVSATMNASVAAQSAHEAYSPRQIVFVLVRYIAIFFGAIFLIDWLVGKASRCFSVEAQKRFGKFDYLAYVPFLSLASGAWGIHVVPLRLVFTAVIILKALLLLVSQPRAERKSFQVSQGYVAFLFLISGFAALIYQIVWQRTLFSAYGTNIESITIIVSLFMFGLGLGSLLGGIISEKFPHRAPELFFICECGIAFFGLVSLPLIHAVSRFTLHSTLPMVSFTIFALLCFPTMLMGATLPILVGHLYRYYRNVGKSVGILYAVNTIGSAIACFITADILFVIAGQQTSVIVAAICNVCVGFLVWQYARKLAKIQTPESVADAAANVADQADPFSNIFSPSTTRFLLLLFAAVAGYISLSQEIVWMRIVSYMTGGRPSDFAHVLGCFLIGVALGALMGKRLCEKKISSFSPAVVLGGLLGSSALSYYFCITLIATLRTMSPLAGFVATFFAVAWTAFLLGGIFTVLCHYAAGLGKSVSRVVSYIYMANIVGSTLGPLLTGFVLMDYFKTSQLVLGLSVMTVACAGVAFLFAKGTWRNAGLAFVVCSTVLMLGSYTSVYDRFFERMKGTMADRRFKYSIENRSGIIGIQKDDALGDLILGGGAFDGRITFDPITNAAGIDRAYMIAALHPNPQEVLEIGLSGGSWARVLSFYKPIQKLTVVEINLGYIDLVKKYESHAPILSDSKIDIVVDDGRRWLQRHPDRRFDFILQNTTFHWRSQIVNLLSEEYLNLCKAHLKPDGVLYYNTTGCQDVTFTAAKVFKYVVQFRSFIAASDSRFHLTPEEIRSNFLKFADSEGTIFERPALQPVLDKLVSTPLPDIAQKIQQEPLLLITDDNMATEYKLERWFTHVARWQWPFTGKSSETVAQK